MNLKNRSYARSKNNGTIRQTDILEVFYRGGRKSRASLMVPKALLAEKNLSLTVPGRKEVSLEGLREEPMGDFLLELMKHLAYCSLGSAFNLVMVKTPPDAVVPTIDVTFTRHRMKKGGSIKGSVSFLITDKEFSLAAAVKSKMRYSDGKTVPSMINRIASQIDNTIRQFDSKSPEEITAIGSEIEMADIFGDLQWQADEKAHNKELWAKAVEGGTLEGKGFYDRS